MGDRDVQIFQERVKQEMVGKSIITCYGKRQTYRVDEIDFKEGPTRSFFSMADGSKMSIAKYFMTEYGLKISSKKQPLIYVRRGKDKWLKIPSEFCLVDGIPD